MTNEPGWHPDPSGTGGERWWDGTRWSEHLRPPTASAPAPGPASAPSAPAPPPARPGPPTFSTPPPRPAPGGPPAAGPPPWASAGPLGPTPPAGPKKRRGVLPVVIGAVAVLVVLAVVAVGAVVLLGGDDPELTWDGDEVAEPEQALARGEDALEAVVEARNGSTVDATRCYFVLPRAEETDVDDSLACGPVLFVDGDPDEAWLRFPLDRSGRDAPAELRVADQPEPAEPGERPRGTLTRPDDRAAPSGDGGIEAPLPLPDEPGFLRSDELVDVELTPAPDDARITTFGATYELVGSGAPERIGEGDEARRPADGERFVAFELAQTAGEGLIALPDDVIRVQVGDAEPMALPEVLDSSPDVNGRFLLSAPVDASVELVVTTTTDVVQRLSLDDGARADDTAAVLLRDDREATVDSAPQGLPFSLSQGSTVTPTFTVQVGVTGAELRYFYGDEGDRVPDDPSGAWLVLRLSYTWPSELVSVDPTLADAGLAPAVWRIRTPGGRTIAAENLADEDGRIIIGFPVPGDITGGTFVVGGTDADSVVFDTGSNRVEIPFELPG